MAQKKIWHGLHTQQADSITELKIGYIARGATPLLATEFPTRLRFEQRRFNRDEGLQGAKSRHLFSHLLSAKDRVWLPGVGVAILGAIGLRCATDDLGSSWGSAARFLTAAFLLYGVLIGALQARSEPTLTDLIAEVKTGTAIRDDPARHRFQQFPHSDRTSRFKTHRRPVAVPVAKDRS